MRTHTAYNQEMVESSIIYLDRAYITKDTRNSMLIIFEKDCFDSFYFVALFDISGYGIR